MKTHMTFHPVVQLDHISFIRDQKTILISIINGYHHPSEGKAEVLGRRFGKTDLRELRLHMGEASSEIKNMLHTEDTVIDIVLSGKFATIGLYEGRSCWMQSRRCAGEVRQAVAGDIVVFS
jgi:ABC-type molybdenum transport system ATPase subunit/photorepair protein PhrA